MSNIVSINSKASKAKFDGENLPSNQIPDPVGYRILLAPISIEETTAGGIIIAREEQAIQKVERFVAKVIKMGNLCYNDDKFRLHPKTKPIPWCNIGDVVSIGQHTGSRLPCIDENGKSFEFILINDDEVNCVINDVAILNI